MWSEEKESWIKVIYLEDILREEFEAYRLSLKVTRTEETDKADEDLIQRILNGATRDGVMVQVNFLD